MTRQMNPAGSGGELANLLGGISCLYNRGENRDFMSQRAITGLLPDQFLE
jgi:hypothetical protein